MNKNLRSNVVEITKTFDNVQGIIATTTKKLDSVADTMASYASKTNVGLYKDLQGQINAYVDQLAEFKKTVNHTEEAVKEVHRRDAKIVSGFDL